MQEEQMLGLVWKQDMHMGAPMQLSQRREVVLTK